MFTLLRYIPQRKVLLFLGDLLIVVFSIPIAYKILTGHFSNFTNMLISNPWIYFLLVLLWMTLLFLNRAYHVGKVTDWIYNAGVFLRVGVLATLSLGFLFFLLPEVFFSKRVLIGHSVFVLIPAIIWRLIFSYLISRPRFRSPVIIVGAGPAGELIAAELLQSQNLGYELKGFVDDTTSEPITVKTERRSVKVPVLGRSRDLPQLVRVHKTRLLVDAVRGAKGVQLLRALSAVEMGQVKIVPMHHLYEFLTAKVPTKFVEGEWLVFEEVQPHQGLGEAVNRAVNFIMATIGLVLSSPIIFVTAIAIKIESPGPVIYQQTRVGLGGREFTVYKFRSMLAGAEKGRAVWAKRNDPRVTRVGRIIRKLRIDEIPQLFNIWIGDMNMVGPRPERPEFVRELEKKIPFYQKRHLVKPGVTGWAQVKYTYGSSTQDALEKLQYELYYIKRRGLILDFIIILKTIDVVLTGRGAK